MADKLRQMGCGVSMTHYTVQSVKNMGAYMKEKRSDDRNNSFNKRSKAKRRKRTIKRVLLSVCLIISVAAGFFVAKAQYTFNQSLNHVTRNYDSALSKVDLSGIKVNSDNDIVNLLFIGNDHRKEWNGFVEEGLPDVMMIGTLDKKHKSLKLTSLLRDMKVYSSTSGKYKKLNECFNDGGIKGVYKAIAENFNIKLDGYVMVGFDAFTQAINAIGGVEVDLTQTEVDYLSQTNFIRKKKYRKGLKVGKQKLNGYQALGYCRIRKGHDVIGKSVVTANGLTDDYGRTWRQRTVISAVFAKMKKQPLSKWIDVGNKVLSNIETDLSNKEILSLMKDTVFLGTADVKQLQIPMEGYFTTSSDGAYLLSTNTSETDWSTNADILKKFIFKYNGKGEFKYDDKK